MAFFLILLLAFLFPPKIFGKGKTIANEESPEPHVESSRLASPGHRGDFPGHNHTFIDKRAIDLFKIFADRDVCPGYYWVGSDFVEIEYFRYIYFQGWDNFFKKNSICYGEVVPFFYSNLRVLDENTPMIKTLVQGHEIFLNPVILGKMLGIPSSGLDINDFTVESFPFYPEGHDMNRANKFLHYYPSSETLSSTDWDTMDVYCRLFLYLCHCVFLSRDVLSKFSGCEKLLTYLVLHKIPVNLPQLILKQMIACTKSSGELYFGRIITTILAINGVDLLSFASEGVCYAKPFNRVSTYNIASENPRSVVRPRIEP